MEPRHIAAVHTPSDPQLHPDGTRIAFVVSRPNLEDDRYDRRIWLWDGHRAEPHTTGPHDSRPRWSPDGSRLAFLRGPTREQQVVCVVSAEGGDAAVVAEFGLGAREAEWSPDGLGLAVVAMDWTEEFQGLDDEGRARKPARWSRTDWRFDNEGFRHDRRSHVYVVETSGGRTRLLTGGDFRENAVAWRPDGEAIAFLSARHERRGLDAGVQPWELSAGGGPPRALAGVGLWDWVGYRPDGTVYLVGTTDPWDWPGVNAVFRRDAEGVLVDLTGRLDRSPLPSSPPIAPPGPQWLESGFNTVLEDAGRLGVIRVDDGGSVETVLEGDRVISGLSARSDGTALAFVASTPTDPGELYWWEGGEERRLTSLNEEFRATVPLVSPEPFTVAADGGDVQAWAYLPEGGDRLPLLLNIHGGPAAQYGYAFFDEFQVYAGAGFGVVACNPRGSSGRGRDFSRAVVGRWMDEEPPDLADLRACVDAALERFPRLDPERIGVMGGSYGGYATARLLALDDRFRSGIVERALTAFPSFVGTSDIGPYFGAMYLGTQIPEGFEDFWKASPMAAAHRISAPTLVIHSEHDWRTPIEQGEQLFTLLALQGVTTEMVRFPDEGHEMSRSGSPRHRLERFEIVLEWHRRHLA